MIVQGDGKHLKNHIWFEKITDLNTDSISNSMNCDKLIIHGIEQFKLSFGGEYCEYYNIYIDCSKKSL